MKLDQRLSLRISSSQKKNLKQLAQKNNMSINAYILHKCSLDTEQLELKYEEFTKLKDELRLLKNELNLINLKYSQLGNNVNQIARSINYRNKTNAIFEDLNDRFLKQQEQLNQYLQESYSRINSKL